MEIQTRRLQLSPLAAEDFLALIEGTEPFEKRFGLGTAAGLRGFIVSDEVSPVFLELLRESHGPDPWQWGFAIIEKSSNLVVGTAGFKGPPDADGVVEIAYGIVSAFQGRGYATEAAEALVAWSSGDSRVCVIRAHTLPEPNASARVLQKSGFKYAGLVIDPDDGPVWRWDHRIGNP